MQKSSYIRTLSQIRNKDVALVGGKNASLGELYTQLRPKGISVPDGFVITAQAYRDLLSEHALDEQIYRILDSIRPGATIDLEKKAKKVRDLILRAEFSQTLTDSVSAAYAALSKKYKKKNIDVAVRSSATAEDLPTASFAGQQESYLNISGEQALLRAIKRCMASLFTDRAISYRMDKGFDHRAVALSVTVQKMVRSDRAAAGVLFTIDTESGFKNIVRISSSYGLGEFVVKGQVVPDEFIYFKPTGTIISKRLGSKKKKLVYARGTRSTVSRVVRQTDQDRYSLTDDEVRQLASWGERIARHYRRPMDIEWAKDGIENKLYIVQARPETVHGIRTGGTYVQYRLKKRGKPILSGESVGDRIGAGRIRVIRTIAQIHRVRPGDVLVTDMTDPDWEPVMKKVSAIITESGGRTCHAAIVSRELGIPCIVGAQGAMKVLRSVAKATVDCSQGETGFVYAGKLPFAVIKTSGKDIAPPAKPALMINLGDPDSAFKHASLPVCGVGLARQEFIITSFIKIHPMALVRYHEMDKSVRNQIDSLTRGYTDRTRFFVDQLGYGIAKIAAAFYPHDVILRFSDFKTNEYEHLIGGKEFEPIEANPMLGWRGASRYYHPDYRPAFDLECAAIQKVRDEMRLTNLKVMVPFCRTPEEGKRVISILNTNGLTQGKNDLEVYVMVEIPSNIILAEQFADIFDGFSIGSNDLTQLTLGLDRDSPTLSEIGDERNEAIKRSISSVIKTAKRKKVKIGICGQAPSDFPEYAQWLAKQGIDSISVTPDSVLRTVIMLKKGV